MVAFVSAAAGVSDVVLHPTVGDHFMGAAELSIRAALSRQDVDGAVAASGAGAALGGQALAGDVGAWLAFGLQRTEVAKQAVQGESGEDQSRDDQDGGQEPDWAGEMGAPAANHPWMSMLAFNKDFFFFGVCSCVHLLCLCDPMFLWVKTQQTCEFVSLWLLIRSRCDWKQWHTQRDTQNKKLSSWIWSLLL